LTGKAETTGNITFRARKALLSAYCPNRRPLGECLRKDLLGDRFLHEKAGHGTNSPGVRSSVTPKRLGSGPQSILLFNRPSAFVPLDRTAVLCVLVVVVLPFGSIYTGDKARAIPANAAGNDVIITMMNGSGTNLARRLDLWGMKAG
jgi:hypothetical protein